jgi:hypothetical protein
MSIHIDRLMLLKALNVVDEVKAKLPPVTEASYIIYTDGEKYYAKSGRIGEVEFSSSNASEVINYAIAKLRELGGGKLFIKRGYYYITNTINVECDNIVIDGEYPHLQTPIDFDAPLIFVKNSSNVRIYHLHLDMQAEWVGDTNTGWTNNGNAIRVANSKYVEIAYNIVRRALNYHIKVGSDSGEQPKPMSPAPCEYIWIHHNYVGEGPKDGINVSFSKNVVIESNLLYRCGDDCISLFGDDRSTLERVVVSNNVAYDFRFSFVKITNDQGPATSTVISDIIIGGNIAVYSEKEGAGIIAIGYEGEGNPPTAFIKDVQIVNNVLASRAQYQHTIHFYGPLAPTPPTFDNITIEGNTVYALTTPAGNIHGILIRGIRGRLSGNMVTGHFCGIVGDACSDLVINSNTVKYNYWDGVVLWYSKRISITDNMIYGNGLKQETQMGISLNYSDNVFIRGNRVWKGDRTPPQAYGINLYNCSNVFIEDNILIDAGSKAVFKLVGENVNIVIRRNVGYVTESSGVATIPAGSTRVTVTHGLSATPTKVLVTPYANMRVWVENITDTSFDIVTDTAPATDVQVAWYAEV